MLNKKFLTKITNNQNYRRTFLLNNAKTLSNNDLGISRYAHYVVDYQIINRNKDFAHDKLSYYGFNPIAPICYVANDGEVVVKMFEMKSINHFLVKQEGENAVEVAMCILVQIYEECKKHIRNFDIDTIDAVLTKFDHEYKEPTNDDK